MTGSQISGLLKVVFVTDDRENYRQGNYYQDWVQAFRQRTQLIVVGPDFPVPDRRLLRDVDLVILGHACADWMLSRRFEMAAKLPGFMAGIDAHGKHAIQAARLDAPVVFLSKNDYKGCREKQRAAELLGVDLVVTHSRQALASLRSAHYRCLWIPFSYDATVFRLLRLERDIDIGFRGNLNDQWNGGIRTRLVAAARMQCADLALDLEESSNGEDFLQGEVYARWMNRCKLVLNTASAIGTVGPKWWEQFACGAVPVAPRDEYEGQLLPDVHYVPVREDMSDLRAQVERALQDEAYREEIRENGRRKLDSIGMDRCFSMLMDELRVMNGLPRAG